ncbi:hypothetical protein ACFZA1_25595 [Streptomyces filipinensis]|uniref:hypothetical protein n=1 Tax=Streptomyces filipinensis TaxID=66887 RepID=UPI0036E870DB
MAGLPGDPELVRSVPALTMAAGAREARGIVAGGPDFDGVLMAERAVALLLARPGSAGPPVDQEEFVGPFSLVPRESTAP